MTGRQLKQLRRQKKWTQKESAKKLGLTQAYLSLLESGKRELTDDLTAAAVHVFQLPAASLPVSRDLASLKDTDNNQLIRNLAAIGYGGFSHMKPSRLKNPAEVLVAALDNNQLDARIVESLPWLVSEVPEISWNKVVRAVKIKDLQNRLGFVTALARVVAERRGESKKAERLKRRETVLAPSRLWQEDVLCNDSITETEKKWIRQNRLPEAEFWRVLSDLKPEHLSYAG